MSEKEIYAGLHPERLKIARESMMVNGGVSIRTVFCELKKKPLAGSEALEVHRTAVASDKEHICATQCNHKCYN